MKFNEFNLEPSLVEAIDYMGFEEATPIQEQVIPKILDNKDLIACAQTGTGKTAAFILPILQKLHHQEHRGINTLIIVPTRELAIQIEQQIKGISYFTNIASAAIYGGGDAKGWDEEKKALTSHTDIIVATPGKLIAHLNLESADFSNLQHLVLDEADKMLDMGFHPDIMKIVSFLPKKRQTLMFSATMPPKIKQLAKSILQEHEEISIELAKPPEGILQAAYLVYDGQKNELLTHLLADKEEYQSILIFTSTKSKVNEVVRALKKNHFNAEGISSNLEQKERNEVLSRFRSRRTNILVATDVLSRGIDIKDIDLIINYDIPGDAEDYVHRIGRTARAKSSGVALTFVNEKEMGSFQQIQQLIDEEVLKIPLPAEIGEGPVWKVPQRKQGKKRPYKKNKYRKPRNKK